MGMLARAAEEGNADGNGRSELSVVGFSREGEGVSLCKEDTDSGGEGMHSDADSTRCH
jgi:hypothetical protein